MTRTSRTRHRCHRGYTMTPSLPTHKKGRSKSNINSNKSSNFSIVTSSQLTMTIRSTSHFTLFINFLRHMRLIFVWINRHMLPIITITRHRHLTNKLTIHVRHHVCHFQAFTTITMILPRFVRTITNVPQHMNINRHMHPKFHVLATFTYFVHLIKFTQLINLTLNTIDHDSFTSNRHQHMILRNLFNRQVLGFLTLMMFKRIHRNMNPHIHTRLLQDNHFTYSIDPISINHNNLHHFNILQNRRRTTRAP